MEKKFYGVTTALITPFKAGKIDWASLTNLINSQMSAGVTSFVVNGTTAESPTLKEDEAFELLKKIRQDFGSKVTLIFGSGSNSTAKSIELSLKAQEFGADALLLVVPYYNKPPQRGLVKHFTAIAEAVKTPCFLYNVPGRTGISLAPESVVELTKVKNIVGIKEASGDMKIAKELKAKCPKDFILLSGDDGTYVDFLKEGGHGVISVSSHIIPKQMINWTNWCSEGKTSAAVDDIGKYKKLIDLLFIEANPIPVKKSLQMMKIIDSSELRLPLVELEQKNTDILQAEMRSVGII